MDKSIAIIGGGGGGLMCAIACLRRLKERGRHAEVIIFEKNARVGKKLLMTGNGKCNFTNTNQHIGAYHSNDIALVGEILSQMSAEQIIEFFEGIGIVAETANGTCVYPRGMQASSVLDALRLEAERLGAKFVCDFEVKTINKGANGYEISSGTNKYIATAVVIASGSDATCGTNDGCALLKRLGHKIYPLYPVLTSLKCDSPYIKTAKGMRTRATVSLYCDGKMRREEKGEVLFCDYGVSGIAVMQLSGIASRFFGDGKRHEVYLTLDMAEEYSVEELEELLRQRVKLLSHYTLEGFLSGFMNKRVAMMVIKSAQIASLADSVEVLGKNDIKKLAHEIKCFKLPVIGVKGGANSQAMGGGASLADFCEKNLMSKRACGLFACGEVLDVYGDCGGYNLTWAWASGTVSGRGAADII